MLIEQRGRRYNEDVSNAALAHAADALRAVRQTRERAMEIFKDDVPVYTFYVDENEKAALHCPTCRFEKIVEASAFRGVKTSLRVKCKCGAVFKGLFEYRRTYRKRVKLEGRYVILTRQQQGSMTVEDLSLGGVAFCAPEDHPIKPGDVLEIIFTLDNAWSTRITKQVEVLSVDGVHIGAKFCKVLERDPDLGLYLMP